MSKVNVINLIFLAIVYGNKIYPYWIKISYVETFVKM